MVYISYCTCHYHETLGTIIYQIHTLIIGLFRYASQLHTTTNNFIFIWKSISNNSLKLSFDFDIGKIFTNINIIDTNQPNPLGTVSVTLTYKVKINFNLKFEGVIHIFETTQLYHWKVDTL